MNIDKIKARLEECENLIDHIGIEVISTPEPDCCVGRMKVDERNRQPFGCLSGGATLALAETVAGCGSYGLCPDAAACVGMNVHANHVSPAYEGETVTATARIVHKGKTTHVWQVDVENEDGVLISSISVTNYVIPGGSDRIENGILKR